MLLQSCQKKKEFNVLDSQNLLTEVLFDPVATPICSPKSITYALSLHPPRQPATRDGRVPKNNGSAS